MHENAARQLFGGAPNKAAFVSPQVRATRRFTMPEETVDEPRFGASRSNEMYGIAARQLF